MNSETSARFQISEKAPLKGWVVSPARGEATTHPWASDDGGRYRQASTAVVFHPSSQPEKETTHG